MSLRVGLEQGEEDSFKFISVPCGNTGDAGGISADICLSVRRLGAPSQGVTGWFLLRPSWLWMASSPGPHNIFPRGVLFEFPFYTDSSHMGQGLLKELILT